MTFEARPDWMDYAACKGMDASIFYPDRGDSKLLAQPKMICHGCEVIEECYDYAIEHEEKDGVWGGTSARERRFEYSRRGRSA